MKKLLVNLLLVSQLSYAALPFYCPKEITCSKEGNIGSCQLSTDTPQYWGNLVQEGKVMAETYTFLYAAGTYDNVGINNSASCIYNYVQPGITRIIAVNSIPTMNIEADLDGATQWRVQGYIANCQYTTTNVYDCPLEELD
jgi:hypothetical protein